MKPVLFLKGKPVRVGQESKRIRGKRTNVVGKKACRIRIQEEGGRLVDVHVLAGTMVVEASRVRRSAGGHTSYI